MILVKLEGGLGNQMFQYALARKLSLKLDTELLLDTNLYTRDVHLTHPRAYGLSHFNIAGRIATEEEIRSIRYPYGVFLHKLGRRIERLILQRQNLKFEPYILKKTGNISLEGFWQSEKYFEDIRETLLSDFTIREQLSEDARQIIQQIHDKPHSISLHVRRTDYVATEENIRFYGSHCNQDYYSKALSSIVEKSGAKDPHVFVFSDDIEWVKRSLDIPFTKTYIPETGAHDYERMMLMSLCTHHIIANSTFSWWGAWLDDKPGKIVVAPSIWIPGINLPTSDIIPRDWIQL